MIRVTIECPVCGESVDVETYVTDGLDDYRLVVGEHVACMPHILNGDTESLERMIEEKLDQAYGYLDEERGRDL